MRNQVDVDSKDIIRNIPDCVHTNLMFVAKPLNINVNEILLKDRKHNSSTIDTSICTNLKDSDIKRY
uniref:Uncharacterized protein n=1 Tax=Tetranychus urticae TaxID=32264 RepID=T1JZJ7_TETUR